jgi:hypothetical protein
MVRDAGKMPWCLGMTELLEHRMDHAMMKTELKQDIENDHAG